MQEFLPYSILFFGLAAFIVQMCFLFKSKVIASDKGIHQMGVTLVVIAILFMLSIKDIPEGMMAAVVGLLGTIIGYVAGNRPKDTKVEQDD